MKVFMFNKIFMTIGLLALIFFSACDSGMKETESGLKYEFIKKGEGVKADSGLILLMNVEYVDEKDSILFTTDETRGPAPFNYPVNETGMFMEGVRMLSEGDSVIFKIPASDFFLVTFKRPVPDGVSPTSEITFNIGIEKVLSREEYSVYAIEQNARLQAEAQEKAKVQLEIDKNLIEEYLEQNEIEALQTESGLFYVINEDGEGPVAQAGDEVLVNYTGNILNGPYFDSSIEEIVVANNLNRPGPYEPIKFRLGAGAVISGWDQGIALLNKGAKATLYIPSTLAYGDRKRSDLIVENSILVFDVELVDITPLEK